MVTRGTPSTLNSFEFVGIYCQRMCSGTPQWEEQWEEQGGTGTPAAAGPAELPSATSALHSTRFQQQTETLGSRVLKQQFPVILQHKLEIADSILLKLWISSKKWHRKPVECSPMFIESQWFTNKTEPVYKLFKNILLQPLQTHLRNCKSG